MTSKKNEIFISIKNILLNEWDPIGIKNLDEAEDEYDTYLLDIYNILLNDDAENKIAEYLDYLVTEQMGLKADKEHSKKISKRLMIIKKTFLSVA